MSTAPQPGWLARARAFRADDPDPETCAELDALLARLPEPAVEAELRDRFETRLGFGTAGLRGLLGAGDNRMNRRVVAQTTSALCAQLLAAVPDAAGRGLCIGFDGRHKSRDFAAEACAIAGGAGFVVHLFEVPVATPLLAYAVRERAAAGGVMITASHNPAAYNGYKVYWEDGAQLNTPHDAEIARRIAAGPAALTLPRLAPADARAQARLRSLAPLVERYLSALERELGPAAATRSQLAATDLAAQSGLAPDGPPLDRSPSALERALGPAATTPAPLAAADPAAQPGLPPDAPPRDRSPQPLDRALGPAATTPAPLIAADPAAQPGLSPDAPPLHGALDGAGGAMPRVAYSALHGVGEPFARAALARAGVTEVVSVAEQAEPDPDFPTVRFPNPEEPGALDRLLALAAHSGVDLALANDPDADRLAAAIPTPTGWRALTGNELGVLLCDYLLERAPRDGKNLVVTTIVSTPLTARVAATHGAQLAITLTGFKWIVRRARELASTGLRPVLGFEEALGYCIGDLVRDKDGIAGAAHVARMAAWHAARGHTLHEALEALYRRHGLFESRQISLALSSHEQMQALSARLAALRGNPPAQLAGLPVTGCRDLLHAPPPDLPPSDVFGFELAHAHRITIRPSGTEPKLKIYLDLGQQLTAAEPLNAARAQLDELARRINEDLRERLSGSCRP